MKWQGKFMIRKLKECDVDAAARLWLDANREAHEFIPREYWEENFIPVKEMLLLAEVYVYVDESENVLGFIGLNGEHIEGIFVQGRMRSKGIGRELLKFAEQRKDRLTLNVYVKNERAVRFYEREGFRKDMKGLDESTGEGDYFMIRERNEDAGEESQLCGTYSQAPAESLQMERRMRISE